MRIFVYGMQSSGASIATHLLAQIPDAYALTDVFCGKPMPEATRFPPGAFVIAKTTISTQRGLDEDLDLFRPDRTVLLLRHPYHNFVSLQRKRYADDGGALDDKFVRLEETFGARSRFDAVVRFEDLVFRPDAFLEPLRAVGIPVTRDSYRFRRSLAEVAARTEQLDGVGDLRGETWGGRGNATDGGMHPEKAFKWTSPSVRARVDALCPALSDDYRSYMERNFSRVRVGSRAFLSDVADPTLRRLKRGLSRRLFRPVAAAR